MKRFFWILFFFLFSISSLEALVPTSSPFLIEPPQNIVVAQGENFEAIVTIRVPAGHYLYADKLDLLFQSLEGVRVDKVEYPIPVQKFDEFLGKQVSIFTEDVLIRIVGHLPTTIEAGDRELVADVSLQGCTPELCLRPETEQVLFILTVTGGDGSQQTQDQLQTEDGSQKSFWELLKTNNFAELRSRGVLVTLFIIFLAGMLTSLTPCVWPVIPIVLTVVGTHPEHRWYRNIGLSLSLVFGMILVYALLGIAAAVLGKNLGFLFQQRIFLVLLSLFFFVLALSLFDLFHFRLPQSWNHFFHNLGGSGYRGAFLAGIGVGFIASPCVGPVLAALLTYVILQKSYSLGFLYLLVFGVGMGVFFVIIGSGFATLTDHLKSGKWMVWVKRSLGTILLLFSLFYITTLVGFDPLERMSKEGAKISWISSEPEALLLAEQEGKPIMIDFYADWCPPCKKLDHRFFSRDDIQELSTHFVMLRINATVETDEVTRVVDKYGVVGWPTILFLNSDGTPLSEMTVTAYDPDRLEENMREMLVKEE